MLSSLPQPTHPNPPIRPHPHYTTPTQGIIFKTVSTPGMGVAIVLTLLAAFTMIINVQYTWHLFMLGCRVVEQPIAR